MRDEQDAVGAIVGAFVFVRERVGLRHRDVHSRLLAGLLHLRLVEGAAGCGGCGRGGGRTSGLMGLLGRVHRWDRLQELRFTDQSGSLEGLHAILETLHFPLQCNDDGGLLLVLCLLHAELRLRLARRRLQLIGCR